MLELYSNSSDSHICDVKFVHFEYKKNKFALLGVVVFILANSADVIRLLLCMIVPRNSLL